MQLSRTPKGGGEGSWFLTSRHEEAALGRGRQAVGWGLRWPRFWGRVQLGLSLLSARRQIQPPISGETNPVPPFHFGPSLQPLFPFRHLCQLLPQGGSRKVKGEAFTSPRLPPLPLYRRRRRPASYLGWAPMANQRENSCTSQSSLFSTQPFLKTRGCGGPEAGQVNLGNCVETKNH